jgi:glycosyltransferase involved in cell wall biosynthesis
VEPQSSKLAVTDPYPEKPLRVLLDARKLLDGGIGVYTENIICGLLAQKNVELTVILHSELVSSRELEKNDWYNSVGIIEDNARSYSFDELFRLSSRIDSSDFDVYHIPHYTLPHGLNLPTVITVHDLIHINYPEHIFYPIVARYLIKSSLKRATRVLTVSQATFNELSRFVKHKSRINSKIRVVPNALDPYFLKSSQFADFLNTRFKLRGDYILTVHSNLKPHKGLRDLLKAFRAIKEERSSNNGSASGSRIKNGLKLILVGKGTEELVEIDGLLEKAGSIEDVYVYGTVTKEELLNLYAGALGVVVSSVAEGFCLPILEAQAQGTPVVARPVPAVKELMTGRDIVCEDFSVAALKNGIVELAQRGAEDQLERGWPNLKRFSREDIGKTVMRVYQEAIEEFSADKAGL